RQEVVDPTRDLTDHSGAQHQLVAHDLGLGGHLTQRRNQKSSLAHGSPSDNRRDAAAASALIARVATIAPIAGAQRRTADRRARGARPFIPRAARCARIACRYNSPAPPRLLTPPWTSGLPQSTSFCVARPGNFSR